MKEKISETHSKSEGEKAEQIADFILDPEKLARISARTLHRLSANFLDRQEKEKEKIFRETNQCSQETKIGIIEDFCFLAEQEKWTKEDAMKFEDTIISIFRKSHITDYTKLIKTINKIAPAEIFDQIDRKSHYASGAFDYLTYMVNHKNMFIQRALCSILAKKIYENNLASYRIYKGNRKTNSDRPIPIVMYMETQKTIMRFIILEKHGKNIMINALEKHQDVWLVREANTDNYPLNNHYIVHDTKDGFEVQENVDGENIQNVHFYQNSIIANLGTKDENIDYRCIRNEKGIYVKDIVM